MGRFSRAWALTKQSGRVLLSDKQLLMFPVMSTLAMAVLLAVVLVPTLVLVDFTKLANSSGSDGKSAVAFEAWHALALFAVYFVSSFVMTFFNVALIGSVMNKFKGEDASVGAGLRLAMSRLPQIAGWSALSATVGVVLKMIEERAGLIGSLVIRLVGVAWAIATFFVVPILVVEGLGPIAAVKRSVEVIRRTWGESLISNLGISLVSGLALLVLGVVPAVAIGVGGAVMMPNSPAIPVILAVLWLLAVGVLIALVSSALRGIVLAATYQYAVTGQVPAGFDPAAVQTVLAPRKKKA